MEEPHFIKLEPAWLTSAGEAANCVPNLLFRTAETKVEPQHVLTDGNLEEAAGNIVKEECEIEDLKTETQQEACNILVDIQNVEKAADLTEVIEYSCDSCHKTFNRKDNLRRHALTHTGERPYHCTICNKSFAQNYHLKCHLLTHSMRKPFGCSICGMTFRRNCHLKSHEIIHSEDRPFSCIICVNSFRRASDLRKHLHTHTKLFSCSICKSTFRSSSDLKRHDGTHGNKSFN